MDFNRDELSVLHTRSMALGTGMMACDVVGYVLSLVYIAHAPSWPAQALFAAFLMVFVGRLFILGHDACHQSLTPSRPLNRCLGTLAFLTSLHPYSLWDLGHNRIHHRYTNQRGIDYVWEPLDPEEYARLPALKRWRYRAYRTPLGHLAYYGMEIWWRKMFFPRTREIGRYRLEYVWDHVLVAAWAALGPALLIALRRHWFGPAVPWSDLMGTLMWGWVLPIAAFDVGISAVIYLHHTHPSVVWTSGEPIMPDAQLTGAVHVILPAFLERTMHHIMDHPAHHARPGIPLYRLSDGQALLEERQKSVIVERWSLPFHLDTLRRCKLFDLRQRRWVMFDR
jgi:omega-6 fatty acid desaturase (delta-12 desaturase)